MYMWYLSVDSIAMSTGCPKATIAPIIAQRTPPRQRRTLPSRPQFPPRCEGTQGSWKGSGAVLAYLRDMVLQAGDQRRSHLRRHPMEEEKLGELQHRDCVELDIVLPCEAASRYVPTGGLR